MKARTVHVSIAACPECQGPIGWLRSHRTNRLYPVNATPDATNPAQGTAQHNDFHPCRIKPADDTQATDDGEQQQPAQAPKQRQDTTLPPDADDAARRLADAVRALSALNAAPLDEARVVELIKEHAPQAAVSVQRIEIARKGAVVTLPDAPRHRMFPQLVAWAAAGVHIALVGPAGSGKTTLGRQIAEALERRFYFTGAVMSEFKLLGYKDAAGTYHTTPFREAFERGGVFLFDECDASIPQALLTINAALANGHMDFPDGIVERHADFVCIAAANTYWSGADRVYVGRNQLDGATFDRFAFFDLPYDEELERQLSGHDTWTARVQRYRAAAARLKVRHIISPRASITGAIMLRLGRPIDEVEAATVWKGQDAATVDKIKSSVAE